MTKKEIREQLAPMYHALLHGQSPNAVQIGFVMVRIGRLYQQHSAGPAWNPRFSGLENGREVVGGNLSETVNGIWLRLQRSA